MHRRHRVSAACAAVVVMATACSPAGGDVKTPTSVVAEGSVSTRAPRVAGADEAVAVVDRWMELYRAYLAGIDEGSVGDGALTDLMGLYDPAITFDRAGVEACFSEMAAEVDGRLFEHSLWVDSVGARTEGDARTWSVAIVDNQVVPGFFDRGTIRAVVVGADGVVGDAPVEPGDSPSCLEAGVSRPSDLAETVTETVLESTSVSVALPERRDPEPQPDDVASDAEWTSRPGLPADPSDPEPIASTGSNTWDLIRVDDPTTFACLIYLGRGPEEILRPDKSEYERVDDAFLFVARFTDGTSIDMRIHPEIGTAEEALAEAKRYVVPLGQLPTLLRKDIGRFAVRMGDETATASPGEGISVQSGNIDIRVGANRLEETLFHEAVHTSLDATYSYQRSQAWLAAQEADGRWLTEYGRDNPDREDLAETALYAFATLHHPGRIPAAEEAAVRSRVPNRIAFIAGLFPPDEPIFETVGPAPECEGQ